MVSFLYTILCVCSCSLRIISLPLDVSPKLHDEVTRGYSAVSDVILRLAASHLKALAAISALLIVAWGQGTTFRVPSSKQV